VEEMLDEFFKDVINIPFSAKMENDLDAISEKKESKDTLLQNFWGPFKILLDLADQKIPKTVIKDVESDVVCEKCGRKMVIKDGRFGKFLACPGFPKCRNTKPLLVKAGVKCPDCGGDVIVRKTRTGRIFYGCSNYPTCKFTSWDKPSATEKCKVCGKYMVEHAERGGKMKLYCSDPKCPNALPRHTSRRKKVTTATVLGVKHVVKKRRSTKKAASKKSKAE
jgi:DNA topoisomerase-1